jgi:hypothetical protein
VLICRTECGVILWNNCGLINCSARNADIQTPSLYNFTLAKFPKNTFSTVYVYFSLWWQVTIVYTETSTAHQTPMQSKLSGLIFQQCIYHPLSFNNDLHLSEKLDFKVNFLWNMKHFISIFTKNILCINCIAYSQTKTTLHCASDTCYRHKIKCECVTAVMQCTTH